MEEWGTYLTQCTTQLSFVLSYASHLLYLFANIRGFRRPLAFLMSRVHCFYMILWYLCPLWLDHTTPESPTSWEPYYIRGFRRRLPSWWVESTVSTHDTCVHFDLTWPHHTPDILGAVLYPYPYRLPTQGGDTLLIILGNKNPALSGLTLWLAAFHGVSNSHLYSGVHASTASPFHFMRFFRSVPS